MRPIFETCTPRADVLSGDLREEMFAAHLRDVIDAQADPIYRDPRTFFERTFPTSGLKDLLREALGRLSGAKATNAPIIRLETSFGGGKTHNLIALYHAARSGRKLGSALDRFVDAELLPHDPVQRIVGIVGSDLDPENGLDHGGITTYTPWGEIAWQIGGVEGYRYLEKSDVNRVAPGVQVFEKLIGDHPALIMLDEFAAFLRKAEAVKVENSTLAEQSTAFLMSLLSFAVKSQRVVLVLSLADSRDAFSEQTDDIHKALREAGSVTARQERIITPTGETEIAAIVSHRLFEHIDGDAAAETAREYASYYEEQLRRDVPLPERAASSKYHEEIVADYPFSPELITTLNRKTSTIPEFQRTRGALRLLAMVVRQLWKARPAATHLIHVHHIDLSLDDVVNDLTSRLKRPSFRNVIEADIVSPLQGSTSHATRVDERFIEAGKPPYARHFGTTVLLHSLVQGTAAGVDPEDALLAVVAPGDEPALITKSMEKLTAVAWFLDYDGRRYRFKTEPSLNKLIADEMAHIGTVKAKEDLDQKIRRVWNKGAFQTVYFPAEAADVEDSFEPPKLVILHYEAATTNDAADGPPELARKIMERTGSKEGFRTYKNNLLFIVADSAQVDRMIEVARRHLAITRIVGDKDRLDEFTAEQRAKLRSMGEESQLAYRIAITKTYRFLFFPSNDAPARHANLAREILPPQDQGEAKDHSPFILKTLRDLDKALTENDPALPAKYVLAKAWPAGRDSISTLDLQREFAKRFSLKIIFNISQLRETIRTGCRNEVWVYQHPGQTEAYGKASPVPPVEISSDAVLYPIEKAREQGLTIKGEVAPACPVCGNPIDQCTCGQKVKDRKTAVPARDRFEGSGTPKQAFQRIVDAVTDAKRETIVSLAISLEGVNREGAEDLGKLALAIPQLGKAAFTVDLQLTCQFEGESRFRTEFRGSWDRYRQLKAVTDLFARQAESLDYRATLNIDFEGGLRLTDAQFLTIRDVCNSLGFGKLALSATAGKDGR